MARVIGRVGLKQESMDPVPTDPTHSHSTLIACEQGAAQDGRALGRLPDPACVSRLLHSHRAAQTTAAGMATETDEVSGLAYAL